MSQVLEAKRSTASALSLDDLYRMVAYIYADKNSTRTTESTFAHFVEVCGMLTIHDRKKKREGVTVTDALCKALGWYFPLLAKLKIRSVEELVFRKFPNCCPYCRLAPHQDAVCKTVRGTSPTLNHAEVERLYQENWPTRPKGLNEWQQMFQAIYPRATTDQGRSTVGLLEELGELAEAVRVFDPHPKYFLGEAADTFSYLMGIANEHSIRMAQENDEVFSFEEEFLKRFPGLCTQCGSKICVCPAIPQATVGRMAKELAISAEYSPFISDQEEFSRAGLQVSHSVLETLGGYHGLTSSLPLDRGDTNKALVILCLQIADAVAVTSAELAESLRAEAYKIGAAAKTAGSPRQPLDFDRLLEGIKTGWTQLSREKKTQIKAAGELVQELGDILDTIRVLFVPCSPADGDHLRVTGELRAAREATKLGAQGGRIIIEDLPAATIHDFRRALLSKEFDLIHFSGHANPDALVFEDASGNAQMVGLRDLEELISRKPSVRCVVLNGCSAVQNIDPSGKYFIIGPTEEIGDDAAIEFSRGFYDALAAGKSFEEAYFEGKSSAKLMGHSADFVELIKPLHPK